MTGEVLVIPGNGRIADLLTDIDREQVPALVLSLLDAGLKLRRRLIGQVATAVDNCQTQR